MRNRPNYWANNYGNNKNKNLGSQSDASSAAFLLLSNGRFRSELPSFLLILQNFSKCETEKANGLYLKLKSVTNPPNIL